MSKTRSRQVPVADAIKNLRRQLQEAIDEGQGKPLRFGVESIEVELKCSLSREASVEGGGSMWVIKTKASGKLADDNMQTIRLKLNPLSDGQETQLSGTDELNTD